MKKEKLKKSSVVFNNQDEPMRTSNVIEEQAKYINNYLDSIESCEEKWFSKIVPVLKDSGLVLDNNDNEIKHTCENSWAAGIIPCLATRPNGDFVAGGISNTINEGFRHVSCNENGDIIDLGPVITPCIIGNVSSAQGIFIPFNNYSIGIGSAMLDDIMNEKNSDNRYDIPIIKDGEN